MTEHKHAEVLRAIADGKEVEYQDSVGHWRNVDGVNPINYPNLKWRVKPEVKSDVVIIHHVSQMDYHLQFDPARVPNVRYTFDGETGKLKSAEVLP